MSNPYRKAASKIFGVSEKNVTDEMRKEAKRVFFGYLYGQNLKVLLRKKIS